MGKEQKAMVVFGTKENLRNFLDKPEVQDALMRVAAKGVDVKQFANLMVLAGSRQPKILQCTPLSLMNTLSRSAELNLPISDTRGLGYAVPFKNGKLSATHHQDVFELQFMPGYRGLIELARRSRTSPTIEARVVHQKDVFEIQYGTDPKIVHKPCFEGDPGEVIGVYAVAFLRHGQKQTEFMTAEEVNKIRARSRAAQDGPWVTDPDEMARKTVVRRLCKYLAQTPELEKALEYDNEVVGLAGGAPVSQPGQGLGEATSPFGFSAAPVVDVEPEAETEETTEAEAGSGVDADGTTERAAVTGDSTPPAPSSDEPQLITDAEAFRLNRNRKKGMIPDDKWLAMLRGVAGVDVVGMVTTDKVLGLQAAISAYSPGSDEPVEGDQGSLL